MKRYIIMELASDGSHLRHRGVLGTDLADAARTYEHSLDRHPESTDYVIQAAVIQTPQPEDL